MTCDSWPARRTGEGLALIGYRGTGKSTVGRIVAGRLNRTFLDADLELEARAGRTIAAIFAETGEPAFRDWEELVLAELTDRDPCAILATGGGAVLREVNRLRIRDFGFVVWLAADPGILAQRLAADSRQLADRPALTPRGTLVEIREVLAARAPFYQGLADMIVETGDKNASEVAAVVVDGWMRGLSP
jgi:shikimate kinase